jgi:acyl dehydratase
MHNDDTAPKYGFRGGLVPGVGVYGYMAPLMAAAFDPDWLTRGHAEVRFLKPVYDGEVRPRDGALEARCRRSNRSRGHQRGPRYVRRGGGVLNGIGGCAAAGCILP